MELTNFQRVCKLGGNLLRRPSNLPRYLAHNVLHRRSPIELGLPWFSYGAIDFLKGYLKREMRVFEFGSGGSTIFFARQCRRVDSVEDDPIWAARVRERTTQLGLANAFIADRPFDFSDPVGFERSLYLKEVESAAYDVIVVDGADVDYTIRPRCFRAAENQINAGGIIIVDDSWRYTQLREANRSHRFEVFETVGPARYGVTSTDIYFY